MIFTAIFRTNTMMFMTKKSDLKHWEFGYFLNGKIIGLLLEVRKNWTLYSDF